MLDYSRHSSCSKSPISSFLILNSPRIIIISLTTLFPPFFCLFLTDYGTLDLVLIYLGACTLYSAYVTVSMNFWIVWILTSLCIYKLLCRYTFHVNRLSYVYVTVSLYFWWVCILCIYMLLCVCTFHVNRLDLCIFTGRYTYLPKTHICRNIHTYSIPIPTHSWPI